MARMRIAVVVPEFPPYTIGGGGVVFEALSRRLQGRHEVRVFTADDSTRSWHRPRTVDQFEQKLTVVRYPLLPMFPREPSLRTVLPPNPRAALDIWRDLSAWDPDVAHVHGLGYAFVDFTAAILRRMKIPYLLTDHGIPASFAERSLFVRNCYRIYHNLALKRTVRGAGRVTAVSTQETELCAREFETKVLTIPNGITPLPLGQSMSSIGSIDIPVAPYLSAAGRFAPHKGFDVLLEALLSTPKLPPCYIAGDWKASEYGRSLHARSRGRIVFVGPLNRRDLGSLFAHSAAVVVPSRSEPFGLVGFEALTAHVRVVATRTGGLFDFANQHIPALLVEPGNSQELADAIICTLEKGPISDVEANACAEMLDRLNWDDITVRYERELASLPAR